MYKFLLLTILSLTFTGCDKPQWKIDEERAYAESDTLIITQAGKYTKTYFTKKNSIVFNSTNTCITFTDLLIYKDTAACGTFTITGK